LTRDYVQKFVTLPEASRSSLWRVLRQQLHYS